MSVGPFPRTPELSPSTPTALGVVTIGTWEADVIAPAYGGTGIAASNPTDGQVFIGDTATQGFALATLTAGANITITNAGGSITISAAGSGITPAALTRVNDTNVTLTLGGTPATALLQATSLTLGWTGTLAPVRGGLGFDASGVAKGGMISGTGAGTFGITVVGTDGYLWTADAASAGGAKWAVAGSGSVANPTAKVGLTPVNGVATSAIRSDGAPELDQGIVPTWTGAHIFSATISAPGAGTASEAFGASASASGNYTVILGNGANVAGGGFGSGQRSIAIGYQATVHNSSSFLLGYQATDGINTVAGASVGIGETVTLDAESDHSVAIGYAARSSGAYSVVLGASAIAGNASVGGIAIGTSASALFSSIALGPGATATANAQFVLGSDYSGGAYVVSNQYGGNGVVSATPTDFTVNATGGSGNNIAGANLFLAGGRPTGSGTGGAIVFETATAGAGGSTLRSLKEWMRITSTGAVNIGTANAGAILTVQHNGINASSTDGIVLQNTTGASAGVQEWTPRIHFLGQGWSTGSGGASMTVDFLEEVQPVQGSSAPTANLVWSNQINAGGYSALMTLTSAGALNLATGGVFQINATTVLSGSALGSGITGSSLTSVGTLTGGATGAGFTIAIGTSTVTGILAVANGGTGVSSGLRVYVYQQSGGGQSISNNMSTAVTWDTNNYDVGGFHSTVTNTSRLTIPSGGGGLYQFIATAGWATTFTASRVATYIRKNGSTIIASNDATVSGVDPSIQISIQDVAVATDYYEMLVYQASGLSATLNTTISAGSFIACRLQAT